MFFQIVTHREQLIVINLLLALALQILHLKNIHNLLILTFPQRVIYILRVKIIVKLLKMKKKLWQNQIFKLEKN